MSDDAAKKSLVKAAGLMGAFTGLSRLLGLVREIVRAHFLGTGLIADAFTVAFMVPNLFRRLVGEGAMTAAAVPVFLDELKAGGKERLSEVVSGFFTLFTFILTGICLLFVVFAGFFVEEVFARGFADEPEKLLLTVELTQYMFFYLLFIGLAAIFQAVLNSFKIFGPSAFTPILLNVAVILSALLLSPYFENPAFTFAIGVMLGGALQLIFQYPYLRRVGIHLRPSFAFADPAIKKILRLMVPGLFGAGVYQINVLLSQLIATYLITGAVSSLQYSSRLEEFTLGVFVVAVSTAVLPTFSTYFRDGDIDAMRRTLRFAVRLVAFITIPATVGMIIIRFPLINLLFRSGAFDDHSVSLTAHAFFFHSFGLVFIGLSRILVPAFYAMKDMVAPVKAAVVATVVNLSLCLVLAGPMQQGGIALSNSVAAFAQAFVLVVFLSLSLKSVLTLEILSSLLRIIAASFLMGAVAYGLLEALSLQAETSRLILLPGVLFVIVVCSLLYAILTWLFKSPEFGELLKVLRRTK